MAEKRETVLHNSLWDECKDSVRLSGLQKTFWAVSLMQPPEDMQA